MAPGMNMLYMYVGSTDTAIISAMTVTTDAPLSKQIGARGAGRPRTRARSMVIGRRWRRRARTSWRRPVTQHVVEIQRGVARRCRVRRVGRRHGPDHDRRWRRVVVGDGVVRLRRRHLARQHRDPVVADIRGEHLQRCRARLLDHAAQRSRCLGQRKLLVLRLRGSNHVHGELVRRHELRHADVGGLSRARESAGSRRRRLRSASSIR